MNLAVGNPTVGDSIVPFDLPATDGSSINPGKFCGRWTVLHFCPSEQVPACAAGLEALRDANEQFKSRGVEVLAISLSPAEKLRSFSDERKIPFPMLFDAQLRLSAAMGALRPKTAPSQQPDKLEMDALRRTLLLGPDLRIRKIYDNPEPAAHAGQILGDLDAMLSRDPPRRVVTHAPVLLLPNVLPVEMCQRLIQIWHDQGNVDSGFMKQVDGKTVGMTDYAHKIRRDHFMKGGPELDALKKLIGARVIAPMKMAFNYEVTRFEDFRIACYDASRGGYFRAHRDNTTDGTAHRRFAMSLLLSDDYDGGCVRFPEYGLHEYRPDVGGAVIFSCSLLHEATDVTRGQRFVLLSFFYGEKEAKMREEYNRRTGGDYRAATA
jgi:peroxiredoxin/predicted 2-oxoglutarate/Fe(II)-dependent dioxygenase YbiX